VATALFGVLGGDPQEWDRAGEPRHIWLQNAGWVWVPLIAAAAAAAWFGMTDRAGHDAAPVKQPLTSRQQHDWRLSGFYLGTFGSFIGCSAALPLLIAWQFPGVNALGYVWLGPLVGALVRPVGAWLADVLGAARVTFWSFIVMAAATCGVLHFLPGTTATDAGFYGFLAMFMVLFMASGIGSGATFSLIGDVCDGSRQSAAAAPALASAVGGYGGFLVPASCGTAIALTGGLDAALWMFLVFYATGIAVAGAYLVRGRRAMQARPGESI
jgi:NNP family nitrate/nitrite transporter-like MFS transporter